MSALGRRFEHRPTPPTVAPRQMRAGILLLALILALAVAGCLWAAGGVALLTRAWEGLSNG